MNKFLIWGICLFISYLVGSISWSYILTKKLFGYDIREKGSGNAGASNVTINHGWKFGVLVFLLDFLKTYLVIKFIHLVPGFENLDQDSQFTLRVFSGLMSIIGHVYPFWMNFKGGKGTASAIGLAFGLDPIIGLMGFLTIALVTMITKYVALGGISLWLGLTILSYIYYKNIYITVGLFVFTILSIYKHKDNLKRILTGEEVTLKKDFKDKDKELK